MIRLVGSVAYAALKRPLVLTAFLSCAEHKERIKIIYNLPIRHLDMLPHNHYTRTLAPYVIFNLAYQSVIALTWLLSRTLFDMKHHGSGVWT